MTTKTEGVRTGEFLLSEGNGSISREVVVIPTGQGQLGPGTLLNSSNQAVSSGANAATATKILMDYVDATSTDVKAVAIARDAEVFGEKLYMPSFTADQKLLVAQTLEALGIVVRWQTTPIASGDAAKIVFTSYPVTGVAGEPAGNVVAEIRTLLGALVNGDDTTKVTLAKKTGTGGAGTLTGGGEKTAVGGIVTWEDVEFSAAGEYVLQASAEGLTGAETGEIVIEAGDG